MQKKDSRDMKSKIASDVVNEYKGDPYIMDKTRKWEEETYKDQLKEEKNKWNESQKKKMGAQKKKYEGKLTSQKQQYEEKIVDLRGNCKTLNAWNFMQGIQYKYTIYAFSSVFFSSLWCR